MIVAFPYWSVKAQIIKPIKSINTFRSNLRDETKTLVDDLEVKPEMQINVLRINNFQLEEG